MNTGYEIGFEHNKKRYVIQLKINDSNLDIEIFKKKEYDKTHIGECVFIQNKKLKKVMNIFHLEKCNNIEKLEKVVIRPKSFIGNIYKIFNKNKILRVAIMYNYNTSKPTILLDYMTLEMMTSEIKELCKNEGNIVVVNQCGFTKVR